MKSEPFAVVVEERLLRLFVMSDLADDFHQTILRLTTRPVRRYSSRQRKRVLQYPIRHFGPSCSKLGQARHARRVQ
jgi:hypothetical protein